MKEKILVVGATGLIGQSLVYKLNSEGYGVVAATKKGQNSLPIQKVKLDLTSQENIHEVIDHEKPDIIINASGLIGFEKCEADPGEAIRLNIKGVKYLVQSASSCSPLFVQLSTDAVFGGDKGSYSENDMANPTTVYGQTKLAGENVVRSSYLTSLIIRSSAVYGKYKYEQKGIRFIDSVLENLRQTKQFHAMIDTFNSPTFLDDLCEGLIFLLRAGVTGTFHLAGPERLSKYDLALKIAHQFGLNSKNIIPVKSKSLPHLSIYPKDTSLDISKITKTGYSPCGVVEGLKRYAQQF